MNNRNERSSRTRTPSRVVLTILLLTLAMILTLPTSALAASRLPDLGTAAAFGVLAGSTVTNTGATTVDGNVGVSPGSSITGFPPGIVNGEIHAADAVAQQAQNDANTAFGFAGKQPCDFNLTGQDLGGMTLVPGVYCFDSSAQLTGQLTLNGLGNPNSVFIFKIGSTLTTASNSSVAMSRNAESCDVFWKVGSSATLGTDTHFAGNIVALTSITLDTGATSATGLYALNGAVTLDTNTIQSCGAAPAPTDTPTPGATDTATSTVTSTSTAASTATSTATSTSTPVDTAVPATNTAVSTSTAVGATATNTSVPVATDTPVPGATNTPVNTATDIPANTQVPTITQVATRVEQATNTALPTEIPTQLATNTAVSTDTPGPQVTQVRNETATVIVQATETSVLATQTALSTASETTTATASTTSTSMTPTMEIATETVTATVTVTSTETTSLATPGTTPSATLTVVRPLPKLPHTGGGDSNTTMLTLLVGGMLTLMGLALRMVYQRRRRESNW